MTQEYSKEFQMKLLELYEMCYENNTDSCILTFEYPNSILDVDITFRGKKK